MDCPNIATLKATTVSRIYIRYRRLIMRGYTMMDPDRPRRAVALLHSKHHPAAYEELIRRHRLNVVYTVHTDAPAVLAALIAVQHALEHLADVVVIPHLGMLEPSTPWWAVTEAADLVTGTQEYPLWSAVTAQTRRQQ